MPTKKAKTPKPKYDFINITLEKRTTRVNWGLSWRVRDKRSRNESLQVFSTPTHIELSGHCTYPEDRKDHAFNFDIYSGTEHEEQATLLVRDYRMLVETDERRNHKVYGSPG